MNLDSIYVAKGLDPVADAFAGTKQSDVFDMSLFNKLYFIIHKGVGTTGTSVITVQTYSDTTPSSDADTAVPFKYKAVTSTDVQGDVTQAAAAGFTLTAGSSQIYIVEVDPRDVASTGNRYVYLEAVESVDAAVLAGIAVIGLPKHNVIGETALD